METKQISTTRSCADTIMRHGLNPVKEVIFIRLPEPAPYIQLFGRAKRPETKELSK